MFFPESGLIVSCYLSFWRDYEKEFIKELANCPHIVALRVEGTQNIRFAKKNTNFPVIGLIKDFKGHFYGNYITPTIHHAEECILAGADFIASDFRNYDKKLLKYKNIIWADVEYPTQAIQLIDKGFPIVSSTFSKNQKKFIESIPSSHLNHINIEGGVDLLNIHEFYRIAKYVTVGKSVHDPMTIISKLKRKGKKYVNQ